MSDSIGQLASETRQLLDAIQGGKIAEVEIQFSSALQEFENWKSEAGITGDKDTQGAISLNIAQGHVADTLTAQYSATGDFTPTDLGSRANVYLHFKTPLNVNENNEMFWFNIKGYSFGSASAINETIAGYCYSANQNISNKVAVGTFNPDSYTDTAGNVILRIKIPDIYYTTIKVDSMKVGNGRLFKLGDLTAEMSLLSELEF